MTLAKFLILILLRHMIGDVTQKPKVQLIILETKVPEIVLALGDLSYQKTADCWFEMMSPLINKTKIVFGDHDYKFKNSSKLALKLDRFKLDNQYYSFDYQNVHFLAMSSEVPFDRESKQYSFVSNDLRDASNNGSIHWIIDIFTKCFTHLQHFILLQRT